jgi:hypothetical protein
LNVVEVLAICTKNHRGFYVKDDSMFILFDVEGQVLYDKAVLFFCALQIDHNSHDILTAVVGQLGYQVFNAVVLYFAQIIADSLVQIVLFENFVYFLERNDFLYIIVHRLEYSLLANHLGIVERLNQIIGTFEMRNNCIV